MDGLEWVKTGSHTWAAKKENKKLVCVKISPLIGLPYWRWFVYDGPLIIFEGKGVTLSRARIEAENVLDSIPDA